MATANQLVATNTLVLSSLALGRALSTMRLSVCTMQSEGGVTAQTIQRLLWLATVARELVFVSPGDVTGTAFSPSWLAKAASPLNLESEGAVAASVEMPSWFSAMLESPNDLDENILALIAWIRSDLEGASELTASLRLLVTVEALLEATGNAEGMPLMPASLSSSLVAENDVTAIAGLLAWCASQMAQTGTVTASDLHELLWMSATLTSAGATLTAQACAAAVWLALATEYDGAGTMGKKLNDAGGSGNPWDTVLENGLTAGEILRLALAMLGGDVVAYDVVKAFNDASKTRLTFTTDEAGNRTLVTFDPSA
jgi:hypothetical protein